MIHTLWILNVVSLIRILSNLFFLNCQALCLKSFRLKKTGEKNPPLPHSLDTLQIQANKKYGYTPSQVLDMVQKMYERKFVTYPRSDCNYIPEAQFEDAPSIMNTLKSYGFKEAENADTSLKSACWNDKKVTAHNAIIPTTVKPSGLTVDEEKSIA